MVKEEILIVGKPGYSEIQKAIEAGWIAVMEPKTPKNWGLDKGENGSITLALERKDKIILDDSAAINLAASLGIETERTTTLLFKAYKKGILKMDETINLLNQLIENGYYIEPKFYILLLQKLK